jgi:hypothetical protein
MKTRFLLLTSFLLVLGSACTSTEKAAAPDALPEFRPTATIKDIMDSLIDPSADELWGSVATVVDAKGVHDKFPRTDEEWKAVRRTAIRLLEGSNLLLIPGRHVAKPGEKSENPGIELEPEQMEALITQDKPTFHNLAHGLHDSVIVALKAIEAKDSEALLDSGDAIDKACENCHLKYWYPNEAKAQEEVRKPPPPPVVGEPAKK